MQMDLTDWITFHEAAARYGIAYHTVQHAAKIGRIRSERCAVRRRYVIPIWDADELWENHVLRRKGKQRCKACLQIKPLADFRALKNGNGQVSVLHKCIECYKPEMRTSTRKYHTSERGKAVVGAWYAEKGGYGAYNRILKARKVLRDKGITT